MVMNPLVETTNLMGPSDDSPRLNENQPTLPTVKTTNVERPTLPCHTKVQLCHTKGLGAPELLLLGIPETLGDLDDGLFLGRL